MSDLHRPGAHERQLLRRRGNVLFPVALRQVDTAALAAARQRDEAEYISFVESFHALLEEAVRLRPSEESDTLLALKARLDEAYTRLASLGGETAPFKQGLQRLTETLMAAVQRAATGDSVAAEELAQERLARQQHYRLVEFPLVADLMRANSPIAAEEVVATLLSAPRAELKAALWLFGSQELEALCREGRQLLLSSGTTQGEESLALMESCLSESR